MFNAKLVSLVLLASLAAPVVALAASSHRAECCDFEVANVRAVRENVAIGKVSLSHLRGAEFTVPATKGLTREWLQRKLDAHLAAAAAMPGCPAGVKGASVSVESTHGGFVVRITSRDAAAARTILERTQAMVH